MRRVLHVHPTQPNSVYQSICCRARDTTKFSCMQNLKMHKTCTFPY